MYMHICIPQSNSFDCLWQSLLTNTVHLYSPTVERLHTSSINFWKMINDSYLRTYSIVGCNESKTVIFYSPGFARSKYQWFLLMSCTGTIKSVLNLISVGFFRVTTLWKYDLHLSSLDYWVALARWSNMNELKMKIDLSGLGISALVY
jgi:hypothetical protein